MALGLGGGILVVVSSQGIGRYWLVMTMALLALSCISVSSCGLRPLFEPAGDQKCAVERVAGQPNSGLRSEIWRAVSIILPPRLVPRR